MGTAGNSTRMRPRIHSFPVMAGGAQVKVMESIIGDIAKDRSSMTSKFLFLIALCQYAPRSSSFTPAYRFILYLSLSACVVSLNR